MTTDDYKKRLEKVISGKLRSKKIIGSFFFWTALILFIVTILSFNIVSFIIALVFFVCYLIIYRLLRRGKLEKYLTEAKENLLSGNISAMLHNLFLAYKLHPYDEIYEIMLDIVNNYRVDPEARAKVLSIVIEKDAEDLKNDKNYQKIIEKLNKIAVYLKKSNEIIKESEEKINELKDRIKLVQDNNQKHEFIEIIKRYENIIKLEKSKINFYEKAQDELIKLRNKHLLNQEIIREKEKLLKLEDKLLEKSLSESYGDSIDGFIIYEREFLKALDEYSETLSVSTDQNIFDEVMREFQNKVNNIR